MAKRNPAKSSGERPHSTRLDLAEQILRKRLEKERIQVDPKQRQRYQRPLNRKCHGIKKRTVNDETCKLNREVERFREWELGKNCPNKKREMTSGDKKTERSPGKRTTNKKKSLESSSSLQTDDKQSNKRNRATAKAALARNDALFRRRYTRGELPVTIQHTAGGLALSWTRPMKSMTQKDYETLIPIFLDGLRYVSVVRTRDVTNVNQSNRQMCKLSQIVRRCSEHPYKFIARQGAYELIDSAKRMPNDFILNNLNKFVLPLRRALLTKDQGE